jgi:hypothetical protein
LIVLIVPEMRSKAALELGEALPEPSLLSMKAETCDRSVASGPSPVGLSDYSYRPADCRYTSRSN